MEQADDLERLRRAEEDLEQRLRMRLRKATDAADGHFMPKADPVAKNLAFLFAKVRRQRRALE